MYINYKNEKATRSVVWKSALGLLILFFSNGDLPIAAAQDRTVVTADELLTPKLFAPEPTSKFLSAPRELLRPLVRAIRVYHEGDADRAAELIGQFLVDAGEEDFLIFTDKKLGLANSVIDVANQMLSVLPNDAIENYQARFGVPAKQRLTRAIENQDFPEIAQVLRRYRCTKSGLQAALLLGHYHLDSGNTLLAAKHFQLAHQRKNQDGKLDVKLASLTGISWYFANQMDQAIEIFGQVAKHSDGRIRLGDQQYRWDPERPELSLRQIFGPPVKDGGSQRVAQWLMPGGNSKRNAKQVDGLPLLRPLWRVDTVSDPDALATVKKNRTRAESNSKLAVVPATGPLVVDGTVLTTDGRQIRGIDFFSGKRLWTMSTHLASEKNPAFANQSAGGGGVGGLQGAILANAKTDTGNTGGWSEPWTNFISGLVSSDGRRVFRLKATKVTQQAAPRALGVRQRYSPSTTSHWLQAIDVRSQGTVLWQAGSGQKWGDVRLNNVSFLGAPLPVDDRLFAIGRRGQEILLLELDPQNGQLVWQQTLAHDESNASYPYRAPNQPNRHSLSPSYANGILVCPTGKATLVGIDILSRSVLWGAQTDLAKTNNLSRDDLSSVQTPQILIDQSYIVGISGDRRARFVSLDLLTGRSILSRGRRSTSTKVLYVAGVYEDSVVMVEKSRVGRTTLDNSSKIWSQSISDYGQPSGRGYMTSTSLYLPTTGGLLLQMDLSNGDIIDAVYSDQPLGNLIVHQGKLISQTETAVTCFPLDTSVGVQLAAAVEQFGSVEKLPAKQKIQQAFLYREQNQPERGLKLLLTIDNQDRNHHFRQELMRTIVVLIRQKSATDIRPFVDDYDDWFDYRLHPKLFLDYVELLVKNKFSEQAIDHLVTNDDFFATTFDRQASPLIARSAMELDADAADAPIQSKSTTNQPVPESLAKILRLTQQRIELAPSCWAAALLTRLAENSNDVKTEIQNTIQSRFESLEFDSPDDQYRFLRQYPLSLVPAQTRYNLATELLVQDSLPAAENLVASLLADANQSSDSDLLAPLAVADIQRLHQRTEKTGLPTTDPLAPRRQTVDFNAVEIKTQTVSNQNSRYVPGQVLIGGEYAHRRFAGKSLLSWTRNKQIELLDAYGRPEQRFSVANATSNSTNRGTYFLQAHHSLALMYIAPTSNRTTTTRLVAVDLSKLDAGGQAVLWQRQLSTGLLSPNLNQGELPYMVDGNSAQIAVAASNPLLTCCCFIDQNEHQLLCLDALTGKTIWQRPVAGTQNRLLADSQRVVVFNSQRKNYQVFDLQTGGQLKTANLPELVNLYWCGDLNSYVATAVVKQDKLTDALGMIDYRPPNTGTKKTSRTLSSSSSLIFSRYNVLTDELIWQKQFNSVARACRMSNDRFLVLSKDGQVHIFELESGREIKRFDSGLSENQRRQIKSIGVRKFGQRQLIVFNKTNTNRGRSRNSTQPFVSGHLLAIDNESYDAIWPQLVELENFRILPALPDQCPLLLASINLTSARQAALQKNAQLKVSRTSAENYQLLGINWDTGALLVNEIIDGVRISNNSSLVKVDPESGTTTLNLPGRDVIIKLKQITDLPPAPTASITEFNPLRRSKPTNNNPEIAQSSPAVDSTALRKQLEEKARQYDASLPK